MLIQRAAESQSAQEYGCDFRRLYPWRGTVDPVFWGSGWCDVAPGEATTPHQHDEHETFIVTAGRGRMRIGDEEAVVEAGDVIYVPPFNEHTVRNISENDSLKVLCVWWGGAEACERMATTLAQVEPA
ncbi:MAG TPA: cupin domain-containing protein [Arenibaculum sp.]|nr:cupin domain-containing protein [Arenibaculum sp.]